MDSSYSDNRSLDFFDMLSLQLIDLGSPTSYTYPLPENIEEALQSKSLEPSSGEPASATHSSQILEDRVGHSPTSTTRRHVCPNCAVKPFKDKAGLQRHLREVHARTEKGQSVESYPCPEPLCRRHKRGFPRKWNMTAHWKRVHKISGSPSGSTNGGPATNDSPTSGVTATASILQENDHDHDITLPGRALAPAASSAPIQESTASQKSICQGLQEVVTKLQLERDSLDEKRNELTGKIAAFQRTIDHLQSTTSDGIKI